jgi:hypothetical protein
VIIPCSADCNKHHSHTRRADRTYEESLDPAHDAPEFPPNRTPFPGPSLVHSFRGAIAWSKRAVKQDHRKRDPAPTLALSVSKLHRDWLQSIAFDSKSPSTRATHRRMCRLTPSVLSDAEFDVLSRASWLFREACVMNCLDSIDSVALQEEFSQKSLTRIGFNPHVSERDPTLLPLVDTDRCRNHVVHCGIASVGKDAQPAFALVTAPACMTLEQLRTLRTISVSELAFIAALILVQLESLHHCGLVYGNLTPAGVGICGRYGAMFQNTSHENALKVGFHDATTVHEPNKRGWGRNWLMHKSPAAAILTDYRLVGWSGALIDSGMSDCMASVGDPVLLRSTLLEFSDGQRAAADTKWTVVGEHMANMLASAAGWPQEGTALESVSCVRGALGESPYAAMLATTISPTAVAVLSRGLVAPFRHPWFSSLWESWGRFARAIDDLEALAILLVTIGSPDIRLPTRFEESIVSHEEAASDTTNTVPLWKSSSSEFSPNLKLMRATLEKEVAQSIHSLGDPVFGRFWDAVLREKDKRTLPYLTNMNFVRPFGTFDTDVWINRFLKAAMDHSD